MQHNDDKKLDLAVYSSKDKQPHYFLEGIEYFAMPAEVEPSEGDRRALAAANPERKMGKRKKLSARKNVQDMIKEMYPASCGLPCQTAPVPPEVLKLNEEYKETLPPGLPPSRPTDHRIDYPEKFRIPAPRLYRLAPSEDKELLKQLDDPNSHGFITKVTSPYDSGILFVSKANGKLRTVVDYRPLIELMRCLTELEM